IAEPSAKRKPECEGDPSHKSLIRNGFRTKNGGLAATHDLVTNNLAAPVCFLIGDAGNNRRALPLHTWILRVHDDECAGQPTRLLRCHVDARDRPHKGGVAVRSVDNKVAIGELSRFNANFGTLNE